MEVCAFTSHIPGASPVHGRLLLLFLLATHVATVGVVDDATAAVSESTSASSGQDTFHQFKSRHA